MIGSANQSVELCAAHGDKHRAGSRQRRCAARSGRYATRRCPKRRSPPSSCPRRRPNDRRQQWHCSPQRFADELSTKRKMQKQKSQKKKQDCASAPDCDERATSRPRRCRRTRPGLPTSMQRAARPTVHRQGHPAGPRQVDRHTRFWVVQGKAEKSSIIQGACILQVAGWLTGLPGMPPTKRAPLCAGHVAEAQQQPTRQRHVCNAGDALEKHDAHRNAENALSVQSVREVKRQANA